MKIISSHVVKIALWLYVVVVCTAIMLFAVVARVISDGKSFFLTVVFPLVILTLWEIWDWDKLLSVRKRV